MEDAGQLKGKVSSRENGAIKLASVGKRTSGLLVITKLIMVFDVYDSEGTAVASFGQSA